MKKKFLFTVFVLLISSLSFAYSYDTTPVECTCTSTGTLFYKSGLRPPESLGPIQSIFVLNLDDKNKQVYTKNFVLVDANTLEYTDDYIQFSMKLKENDTKKDVNVYINRKTGSYEASEITESARIRTTKNTTGTCRKVSNVNKF